MNCCPLCSDVLLRHARAGQTYWLCRRCRLEVLNTDHARTVPLTSNSEVATYVPLPSKVKREVKRDDFSHPVVLERSSQKHHHSSS